jgi:hypothetical protein
MPNRRYLFIQAVQQLPGVRAKLAEVADRKAAQAAIIARQEEDEYHIIRSDGTRPKGRSYSRLAVPAIEEFGDSNTRRRRILARVVRS